MTFNQTDFLTDRARSYLAKIPPAISGQGGHNQLFKAACVLVQGFGLDSDTAEQLLMEDYNPRCEPEWTSKEIQHKVDDAMKAASCSGKPPGYLLQWGNDFQRSNQWRSTSYRSTTYRSTDINIIENNTTGNRSPYNNLTDNNTTDNNTTKDRSIHNNYTDNNTTNNNTDNNTTDNYTDNNTTNNMTDNNTYNNTGNNTYNNTGNNTYNNTGNNTYNNTGFRSTHSSAGSRAPAGKEISVTRFFRTETEKWYLWRMIRETYYSRIGRTYQNCYYWDGFKYVNQPNRKPRQDGRYIVEDWCHIYDDGNGLPYLLVNRLKFSDGQKITPIYHWRPNENAYFPGDGGFSRIPYRASELKEASFVHIVEGEKCADILAAFMESKGVLNADNAVTCFGGCNSFTPAMAPWFKNKSIMIYSDNDEPGKKFAMSTADGLADVAKEIQILYQWPEGFSERGDIADWILSRMEERR